MIPWQEKCPQLSPETYLLILYFCIDVNLLETQGKRSPGLVRHGVLGARVQGCGVMELKS